MLLRVSALTTALVLLLSACSHENDGKRAAPAEREVLPLPVAWQVPVDHAFGDSDRRRGDGLWTTSEQVSVIGDTTVTTYDIATGEQLSQVRLPGSVCAASPDVNGDGIGVVAVGAREDGVHVTHCAKVVAVDTVAGTVRWQAPVREEAYLSEIAVGARTVAVTDAAAGARRLDLRDGSRLATLGTGGSSADGVTVVAQNAGSTALQVFEQDSGRLVRTLPSTRAYDVDLLLPGTDPVLVAINDQKGFFVRDLSGKQPRAVGRGASTSYPRFERTAVVGGTPVVQYGGAGVVDRWDPATRRLDPLTVLEPSEVLVGVREDRLITLAYDGDLLAPGAVVRSFDPDDPAEVADPEVLGTVERSTGAALGLSGPLAVVGDLLLAETDDGLTAFELRASGRPTSDYLPAPAPGAVPPRQVADLCTGLTPATLDLLGYRGAGTPVGCSYYVRAANDTEYTQLRIAAFAQQGEGELTPLAQAEALFANTAAGDEAGDQPVLTPLPADGSDLGDEAALDAGARTLLVRQGSVVLHLRMTGSALAPAARRATLTAVARDLLAELARRTASAATP